ncbi:hypothetical protein ABL78_4971 [Leptomonas seymouri]|uniref:Uncharacterized protein n=1 Tax=Leptomonas seymouri TaxID=5684 RepID=A0A0N0P525_LEPSE|nr:hypothetical protein ABL78_4971 [Leptomonas seymouri]|eukprot:KPI85969.1 hypothetical protein ABL78_4971 [Leptomonas seymouri]
MDVDTLLTRQMELHTSVRHPPQDAQGLVQLMDIMRNYKSYFESLRKIAGQFNVEPETVFQAFMYISVGGTVNFDRQHQDGSVPMHQAKVLARSNAIELASTLRKELPNSELMVYVGLSRDLRTTLRVKVEDGNDLKTAETSVCEAVEYLNYIDRCASHNPENLFKFYMAEDPASLTALLNESDLLSMTLTMDSSTMPGSGVVLPAVFEESGAEPPEPTPLPEPLSSFLQELQKQCELATGASPANGSATRRLKAAQVVMDWVTAVPVEYFAEHAEKIVATVSSTLSLLVAEKRSALCRVGCEVITVLMQRLSPEPVFLEDVDRGLCSTNPDTFSNALSQWTGSLAKGTYVTIAAISTAADAALRAVSIQSRGHMCVVKKLLAVLSNGTQTELRRKCLGYLSLCVVAAHAHRQERVRELIRLLAPVAVNYVSIGDSPSRKMARALCSVLRVLAPASSPTSKDVLAIADERIEHLVQQERPQVEPAVLGGPRDLEELLFEADTFVSSMRSSFSNSSPRHSGRASAGAASSGGMRGRGRGVAAELRRTNLSPLLDIAGGRSGNGPEVLTGVRRSGQPPLAVHTSSTGEVAVPRRVTAELPRVQVPAHRQSGTQEVKSIHVLGEVCSPTRRASAATGGAGVQRRAHEGRQRSKSPQNADVKGTAAAHPRKGKVLGVADDGVYDTDSFLSGDSAPKKNAKAEDYSVPSSSPSSAASGFRITPGQMAQDGSGGGMSAVVASHKRDSVTRSSAPLLPSISSQSLRSTIQEPHNNRSNDEDHRDARGTLQQSSSHRGSAVHSGADRPVPLSLRDSNAGCDDGVGVPPLGTAGAAASSLSKQSSAEAVGAPRITRSLRRKIDENKTGKDGDDPQKGQ